MDKELKSMISKELEQFHCSILLDEVKEKERFDALEDKDKMKIVDTLSATTKANQRWAEGKRKKMTGEKK